MEELIHLINGMSPYLLLGFLLAGLMHAYLPPLYFNKYLSSPSFRSSVYATLFGIPLPLCSCGVIPTAMSLHKEGASKTAVTSFLIATPQTGVDSIIATYSLMGWPFAIVRPIAAIVTALFGGVLSSIADNGAQTQAFQPSQHAGVKGGNKIKVALEYAYVEMMGDIGKWLMLGLVVAGLIGVLVPNDAFAIFQNNTAASMLLVLCISIPMYMCATGSIPIAVMLIMKGLTPGAGLVLLMAGPACNIASMLVVKKVLGTKTLFIYLAAIVLGAVSFGILIDYLQFNGVVNFTSGLTATSSACCTANDPAFAWLCTALLFLLLLNALLLPKLGKKFHFLAPQQQEATTTSQKVIHITGMSCVHCKAAAEKALLRVNGVEAVTINLESGEAKIVGSAQEEDLKKALEAIGFGME
ncbi:MAG: permease [Paludibacteraceae bacterium]|nr:permease [Paludibacteraceae bacterium]